MQGNNVLTAQSLWHGLPAFSQKQHSLIETKLTFTEWTERVQATEDTWDYGPRATWMQKKWKRY